MTSKETAAEFAARLEENEVIVRSALEESMRDPDNQDGGSIWDNPAFQNAWNQLPDDVKEHYRNLGKQLHSFDFTNTGTGNDMDLNNQLIESAAYVMEGLKSGLSPSMLKPEELEVLNQVYGQKWWQKLDYEDNDIQPIIDDINNRNT